MTARKLPNIVLTIADDQRGTALGCAGIEPVITPSLDRLASRGTRFRQAQHFGSCHGAVCSPSRAMLHTGYPYFQLDIALLGGMYPPKDRAVSIPPTLGQKLRGAGYHAFATGKWHNGVHSFHPSFDSGDNLLFTGMADHWFTRVHDFDPSGKYPPEAQHMTDGFSTEIFAQSAIDFIQSRERKDQPFFCYCAFSAPHDPRTPPDAWRRRYDPTRIILPPNADAKFFSNGPTPLGVKPVFDIGSLDERDELLLGTPRDAKEIQRSLAEYYGMVSHMDEWIGRVHAAVDAIGELENTIFIHTADHGLAIGQHGLLGKQNLYQHSLNVPLILAGPEIPAGIVSDDLCYQHDLHPTLTAMAGVESAPGFFQNFLPTLKNRSSTRQNIGAAFRDIHRSMRDARYKLIEFNVNGVRRSQLFDLVEDPWETKDLIADPEHQPIVHALRKALQRWQQETGDKAAWAVDGLS